MTESPTTWLEPPLSAEPRESVGRFASALLTGCFVVALGVLLFLPRSSGELAAGIAVLLGLSLALGLGCWWIGARERERDALRDDELRLRQIVDLVPHLFFATDGSGRLVLANRAVADAFGTSVEELLGKRGDELAQRFGRAAGLAALFAGSADAEGTPGPGLPELAFTDARGRERVVQLTRLPFRGLGGDPDASLGFATDVTDRHRAESERLAAQERAQRTERLESLGLLAGGVAHDFNNLLVGILANASLALDELEHGSPARETVGDIEVAARRAAELTRQLLACSGRSSPKARRFALRPLLLELVQLVRATLPPGIELALDLDARAAVRGDATQVRQVAMNLLVNAVEALGERGGRVSVRAWTRARADEPRVDCETDARELCVLEVEDDGPGMDEETRRRLFEPFFTTKPAGRGLGLAAAQGLVRAHGGALEVESEVGRGARFRAYLPAASRSVVLVVEDDPLALRAARGMLEHLGHAVLEADSGSAALRRVEGDPGALRGVLLDLTLPDLGAARFVQELRALAPDVPVLLTSGCDTGALAASADEVGAQGSLPKPFTLESLADGLERAGVGANRAVPAPRAPV